MQVDVFRQSHEENLAIYCNTRMHLEMPDAHRIRTIAEYHASCRCQNTFPAHMNRILTVLQRVACRRVFPISHPTLLQSIGELLPFLCFCEAPQFLLEADVIQVQQPTNNGSLLRLLLLLRHENCVRAKQVFSSCLCQNNFGNAQRSETALIPAAPMEPIRHIDTHGDNQGGTRK